MVWGGIALLLMTLVAGIAMGAVLPLMAQVMQDASESEAVIGWAAAISSAGSLIGAPLLTPLHRWIGMRGTVALGFVILSVPTAAMALWPEPVGFGLLRLIAVIGMTLAWVTAEAWMVSLAPAALRGRIMALYATTFYAGIACGPLLLLVLGTAGPWPFVIVGAILMTGVLPLVLIPAGLPRPSAHADAADKPGLRLMLLTLVAAPVLMTAALMAGAVEQVVFGLGTAHWRNVGWTADEASVLLTAFGVGGTVLMLGLGFAADRLGNARTVMVLAVVLFVPTLAGLHLLALSFAGAFGLSVLLGGLGNSMYTLSLVVLGERFAGLRVVAANAMFVVMYTSGTLLGPAVAGPVMAHLPKTGYLWSLGGAALAFLTLVAFVSLVRLRRGMARGTPQR